MFRVRSNTWNLKVAYKRDWGVHIINWVVSIFECYVLHYMLMMQTQTASRPRHRPQLTRHIAQWGSRRDVASRLQSSDGLCPHRTVQLRSTERSLCIIGLAASTTMSTTHFLNVYNSGWRTINNIYFIFSQKFKY